MVPTLRLPSVRNIASTARGDLAEALEYLSTLYQPPVRGSRRRRSHLSSIDNGGNEHFEPFERNYTIRWLNALICYLELEGNVADSEALVQSAASLLALCSGTAAAGTFSRDFDFTSTHIPSCSVTAHIKDIPLNNHDYASVGAQTWGGACVLSESIVDEPWKFGLCYPCPPLGNSTTPRIPRAHPLRILELGAGTGLVSLTTGKLLEELVSGHYASSLVAPSDPTTQATIISMPIAPTATIIATDNYPPVLENLASNITANFSAYPESAVEITCHPLDWSHFASTYASSSTSAPVDPMPKPPSPFNETFDVILGADIVYEPEHASWIKSCLSVLLRKPRLQSDLVAYHSPAFASDARPSAGINNDPNSVIYDIQPTFHLVIPLRSTHAKESQTIETVFPFAQCSNEVPIAQFYQGKSSSPRINEYRVSATEPQDTVESNHVELCILSKETIICDAGEVESDRHRDEGGIAYLYYTVGWSAPESMEHINDLPPDAV